MGEVYRASHTRLGREVAIKVLPARISRDPQSLGRFEREAKALAALNHPHIAVIHGFDADQGTHFLVLEVVEGQTHSERLRRGRLPSGQSAGMPASAPTRSSNSAAVPMPSPQPTPVTRLT